MIQSVSGLSGLESSSPLRAWNYCPKYANGPLWHIWSVPDLSHGAAKTDRIYCRFLGWPLLATCRALLTGRTLHRHKLDCLSATDDLR